MNADDELDVNDPKALDEPPRTQHDPAGRDAAFGSKRYGRPRVDQRFYADPARCRYPPPDGPGRGAIVEMFLTLLATEPDTFIIKKHGRAVAEQTMTKAREVLDGRRVLETFDAECIDAASTRARLRISRSRRSLSRLARVGNGTHKRRHQRSDRYYRFQCGTYRHPLTGTKWQA